MTERTRSEAADMTGPSLVWVGSYTADSGAEGRGVESLVREPDGSWVPGGLGALSDSPSFLATHPALPVLYAVNEHAGRITAYARDGARRLVPLGEAWRTGQAGCHVAVDPAGRFAVVTCWGDGRVLLFDLDLQGRIVGRTEAPPARDPYGTPAPAGGRTASGRHTAVPDPAQDPEQAQAQAQDPALAPRQSRAHSSLMLGGDRVMTTDLGFDLVRVWRYQPGSGLVEDHRVVFPEGSGPRHLALHDSGRVYVDTELSVEVGVLAPVGDRYVLAHRGPAMRGAASEDDTAAEIALSDDGRFAYAGIRGADLVSTLAIEPDGSTRPLGEVSCGGRWPRHHAVVGGQLLVANERSSTVTVLALDGATGLPGAVLQEIPLGSPTALIRQP